MPLLANASTLAAACVRLVRQTLGVAGHTVPGPRVDPSNTREPKSGWGITPSARQSARGRGSSAPKRA